MRGFYDSPPASPRQASLDGLITFHGLGCSLIASFWQGTINGQAVGAWRAQGHRR